MTNKEIAQVLRNVAERIYNGERIKDHKGIEVRCGLCFFAYKWHGVEAHMKVYKTVRPHLRGWDMYLCPPGTRYEQRAMFALLLAEQLNPRKIK